MDRRYRETRTTEGVRASTAQLEQGERLVRQYLANARAQNAALQSYGGSTGGISSAGGGELAAANRNLSLKEMRQIFRDEGSAELGARAMLAEIRGYRNPAG